MESTGNDVSLLLGSELDEVNGISGHADGQLRIVLGMLLSVQEHISVQHVYVEVMAALCSIAVK